MAKHRRYLILVMLIASPFLETTAQTTAPAATGQPTEKGTPAFSFCTITLAEDEMLGNLYFHTNDNEFLPFNLSLGRRSKPVTLKKKPANLIFVTRAGEDAKKQPIWKTLTQIAWPTNANKVLIAFAAIQTANGKEVRGLPMDDSLETFPIHSTRALNLTGQELYARIGTTDIILPQLLSKPTPYPPELLKNRDGQTTPRFPLGIAIKQEQGDFKILYRGYTEAWLDARKLLIIRQDDKNKVLQVQELVDKGY